MAGTERVFGKIGQPPSLPGQKKNKRLFADKADNPCVVRGPSRGLRTDFLLVRPRRANILIAIFLASPP